MWIILTSGTAVPGTLTKKTWRVGQRSRARKTQKSDVKTVLRLWPKRENGRVALFRKWRSAHPAGHISAWALLLQRRSAEHGEEQNNKWVSGGEKEKKPNGMQNAHKPSSWTSFQLLGHTLPEGSLRSDVGRFYYRRSCE